MYIEQTFQVHIEREIPIMVVPLFSGTVCAAAILLDGGGGGGGGAGVVLFFLG